MQMKKKDNENGFSPIRHYMGDVSDSFRNWMERYFPYISKVLGAVFGVSTLLLLKLLIDRNVLKANISKITTHIEARKNYKIKCLVSFVGPNETLLCYPISRIRQWAFLLPYKPLLKKIQSSDCISIRPHGLTSISLNQENKESETIVPSASFAFSRFANDASYQKNDKFLERSGFDINACAATPSALTNNALLANFLRDEIIDRPVFIYPKMILKDSTFSCDIFYRKKIKKLSLTTELLGRGLAKVDPRHFTPLATDTILTKWKLYKRYNKLVALEKIASENRRGLWKEAYETEGVGTITSLPIPYPLLKAAISIKFVTLAHKLNFYFHR